MGCESSAVPQPWFDYAHHKFFDREVITLRSEASRRAGKLADPKYPEQGENMFPELDLHSRTIFEEAPRQKEGLSNIPVSGFHVRSEVETLTRDFSQLHSQGLSVEEAAKAVLERTQKNIEFWLREYPLRMVVLPIDLEISEVDGLPRIMPRDYGEKPWLKTISEEERSGTVKDTCKRIEEFMLNAKPGSVAFFVSPPGWSGLTLNMRGEEKEITYPDTQTYVYQITPEGNMEAYTLITQTTLEDAENLLFNTSEFDLPSSSFSERARIERVVKSPAFFEAEDGFAFDVSGVAASISATSQYDSTNLFHLLKQKDSLLEINDESIKEVIEQFKVLATSVLGQGKEDEKLLESSLTKTLLTASYLARKSDKQYQEVKVAIPFLSAEALYQEAVILQKMGGCNGVACSINSPLSQDTLTILKTPFGQRAVELRNADSEGSVCKKCGSKLGEKDSCKNCMS